MPRSPAEPPVDSLALRAAPAGFVVLWSTGWLSAGLAAPYADPLTFLSIRFALAALCVALYAWFAGARWPRGGAEWGHALVSGLLLHALYLGGVWWAVSHGLPAVLSGLIAALQPILTAALAPMLAGERIGARRWAGIALGFVGIATVLAPKLVGVSGGTLAASLIVIFVNVAAMLAVTLGTFYQKRFLAQADLRSTTALQYFGALLVVGPLALATEPLFVEVNTTTVLVMAWSVLGLSIGAIAILFALIRRGAVSRAALLIYLVPPVVALQTWLFLGETLSLVQVAGMAITVLGVALASRRDPLPTS